MGRFGVGVVVLGGVLLAGLYGLWTSRTDDPDPIVSPTTSVVQGSTSTSSPTTSSSEPTTTVPEETSTSKPVSTTTTVEPTTSTTIPPFSASVTAVDAGFLSASWREGCPVTVEDLRLLTMTHWGYDGNPHTGRLVVAAEVADGVIAVFADLYDLGFPIERMEPVEAYDGDDDASMTANNTSAFNCRAVTGGTGFSEHSFGRAIDLNPLVNPYVKGSTVLPEAGAPYADRTVGAPGMVLDGDEVVAAFLAQGWIWGGTWESIKDYQHFSTSGR